MGMFDTVWIQNPKILYDEFGRLNFDTVLHTYEEFSVLEWQTKDGECLLGRFKLHTDGRFTYNSNTEYEFEDYTILNRVYEIHTYDKNRNRLSCCLRFENGKLNSVDAISIDAPKTDLLEKLKEHKKNVLENKSLWGRIKKMWRKSINFRKISKRD
jgi:hypothetical protein